MPTFVKPKRFLVFDYYDYYPGGGWNDFEASYDSIEDARAHQGWRQIVDIETGDIEGDIP